MVNYGTRDEQNFIRRLGKWTEQVEPSSKLSLLKKYKEAMKSRVRWGLINPYAIERTIEEEIRQEELQTTLKEKSNEIEKGVCIE